MIVLPNESLQPTGAAGIMMERAVSLSTDQGFLPRHHVARS
jgi:hypothetical protein